MLARLIGLAALLLALAAPLAAQDIPPPLRDWQGWVLHDAPAHACPYLVSGDESDPDRPCAWPGTLTLAAGAQGASFAFDVHVDAPSWVALPGGARHWPQAVSVDRQGGVVLDHDGTPALRLAPGDYRVQGELPWATRPARLQVPTAFGLVALSVDGKPVARLERHADQLTLGEAAAAQRAADALSLRVYRRLADGVPAMLQTQLEFTVAGSAREASFGPVLPPGFVATALDGDLPAQLAADGQLKVQLRPGSWTLTLDARATTALAQLAPKLPAALWPQQEIWSYADDPALRTSRAEGQAVDAAQAGVPGPWRALPAFALAAGHSLTIVGGARGEEGGKGDQLQLDRSLWLDFDGRGLSAVDHLRGELRHQQRLDVAAPWQLQRASEAGTPLLVTQGANGARGVELRLHGGRLDLAAGLRLPHTGGALPVNAWGLPLDGIRATLHLPYGYRLLAAPGADRAPHTWVAGWSLLSLFVLALVALLAGRLLGWPWGALAAGYLVLGQQEPGAPLWTLAAVLLLALLWRALPAARLRSVVHGVALATLVLTALWSLPFAAQQLQYALHPQLEPGHADQPVAVQFAPAPAAATLAAKRMDSANLPPPPPPPAPPAPMAMQSAPMGSPRVMKLTTPPPSAPAMASADMVAQAPVQAGAGIPSWDQGNDYRLDWSGPVTTAQTVRLVVAPRWLVRVLRVLLVGLLAILLARLALALSPRPWRWRMPKATAVVGSLLLAGALLPALSHAQSLPSQPLLQELKARLTEAPKCAPDCAEAAQAQLTASADALDLALEIHVGATAAVPLPQAGDGLALTTVIADGKPAALTQFEGLTLVRLERGVHRLDLHYRLGSGDAASLQFALPPQRVQFRGNGWTLAGVDDQRLLGDSLTLQRVHAASGDTASAPVQAFPPYVQLTRRLSLGVEWQVQNRVQRIAPASGGFSVSLPLLPGEHPLGDGVVVKGGRIEVTFNADAQTVSWTSRLDHAPRLALTAPSLGERAETWAVDAAPMWRVEAHGVPPSASASGLRFQPLPGETLQLAFSQPPAVAGGSLAFDRVAVRTSIGQRARETTLDLGARSTRGGEHAITLPAGAELLGARRDGEPLNLAVRAGQLSLPLMPGTHDYQLRLRTAGDVATLARTSVIALDAPSANLESTLTLPHDRWVLWTWGPTTGPAVLYWARLIVLLGVAWLLARYAPTPLKWRHWLLLGLGFSALAWGAFALVAAWLVASGLRARLAAPQAWPRWGFNLAQVALAVLTVAAIAVLVAAVPKGLLGVPDMQVAGNGSSAWNLTWFADRSGGALPSAGVLSVPLWFYKLAMLAWALWLAFALIGWLRWVFEAWSRGGYWRRCAPRAALPPELPHE